MRVNLAMSIVLLLLCCNYVAPETPDICLLPEPSEDENMFCELIGSSYRYEEESEMCVEFVDGGCGGNDNKFESLRKCVEFCNAKNILIPPARCLRPFVNIGKCKTPTEQYYFDKVESECKSFNYTGCWGNENRFEDLSECKELCEFN